MSYVKILIHAVWGTKRRQAFLVDEKKDIIINHILENAKKKGIYIYKLNGHKNHLHCLFSLNSDMTISKAMQLIKGESAFLVNKNKIFDKKFEWADEYFAVSVSESAFYRVKKYIENQEQHHKKVLFKDEYNQFMKVYRFEG